MFPRKMFLSFTRVLLQFLHFLASCNQVQSTSYRIVFDPISSPPPILPKIPKYMVYSAPLNQVMSKAIIVQIRDQSNNSITPEGNPDVLVSTMDVSIWKGIETDVWKQTGGKLCQRTLFGLPWPERLNREQYTKMCGSNENSTVLVKKFIKDMLILDWLSHEHPIGMLPANSRFLRVSIPNMNLTADSNAFNITIPAASLFISQQPPKKITANTPFNVSAEIRDANGTIITEGLDSILYVELTVPYEYKQFHHKFGKDMRIVKSDLRLRGSTVIHQGTNDEVMRKQASNGRVYFTNIRILDIIKKFKLNLTMYMSKDPWLRSPDCPTCYADISEKEVDSYGTVRFKPMTKSILSKTPAVSLTDEFEVIKQLLEKIVLRSPFKQTGQVMITRNFPIPGPMYLEVQDINGNRIYTGPHANQPLEIVTYPNGVCISVDHTTYIREGYEKLQGSICQIISSVYLSIRARTNVSAVANSTNFKVVGDVHLAHFDDFTYSATGQQIQPNVNSFIRFGANDINSGTIPGVLKHFQMKIIVDTIETQNDVTRTFTMYSTLRLRSQREPSKSLRGVIMPSHLETAVAIIRDVNNDEIAMISLTQKDTEFTSYQFFNRICWNWNQISISFLTAVKERGWYRISIVRMNNDPIPDTFREFSSKLNITIQDVPIPLFDPIKPAKDMLAKKMQELKDLKTRIIIALIIGTYIMPVLNSAYDQGLSSLHGFQWIFLSDYALEFPLNKRCGPNIGCSEAFEGALMFTEAYNISHFHSDDWHRVLANYFAADQTMLMGPGTSYLENDIGAFMGLGYDAVWLFADSLNRIISRQLTATGWLITQELRKITIDGLSGLLKLNNVGDRLGYIGNIKVVTPEPESRTQLIRFIKRVDNDVQIELKYGIAPKQIDPLTNISLTKIPLPTSSVYNLRRFVSYSGGIDEENNMLVFDRTEAWPSIRIHRFEEIVPQYLCKGTCGKRLTMENVNLYDRGKCISMNTCKCFLGYYGDSCEKVMCVCLFGHCLAPFKCICAKGWSGKRCNKPICSFICSNGRCITPETCKCSSSAWIDSTCSIHIASIIVPLILILAALGYLAYIGSFWLRKYLVHRAALSDLSWLVQWTDVTEADTAAISRVSCAFAELYTWNREKWYVKCFNSKTIDVDDIRVRLDMVKLVALSHKNLITYGGACLTYPHVCLLLEPAHKGSLEDILVNTSIQLGWDFRFSFMKDICCGMNFLHTKTDLNSHGRLKSSNCLLDNRWTIRLSGFGAPTIRYGPYLICVDKNDPDVYNENQMSLLWTAPELLKNVSCLDDVRNGTKEGDIYSFGIIIAEIATRNVPFEHERNFLAIPTILDLILDANNPKLGREREVWRCIGGDLLCVRPQIKSEHMPEGNAVKNKFMKMLDDVWCNDSKSRLPFHKLGSTLNDIHPSKGELVDNLIHLLESYSNNLEQVVVDRTNDLVIEKVKIDNIISQILPKIVVESLKNGEKVQPEIFDDVTVFYSEILGFTTIASKCEPIQVVDLLNNLYGKFDSILAQYDVYKVETIGDSYVVSSGVPHRNGHLHAGEIATATIDIVCTIMTVLIPHLPKEKLLLRIGIHSGPVIAGVVGLKMPRYTLFGETMQIASMLESTSKPLHIQVSKYTINILNELGGYIYKRRGDMEVCGRTITTYWLIGKEGYDKVLPDVDG